MQITPTPSEPAQSLYRESILAGIGALLAVVAPLAVLSLGVGGAAVAVTWRWFPVADMLRALLLDTAVAGVAVLLPLAAGRVWLGAAFVPLLISAVAATAHLLWYEAPISPFAVLSLLETSPAESREFLQDRASFPAVTLFLGGLGTALLLLARAWRLLPAAHSLTTRRPVLRLGILVFCLAVAAVAIHKGDRLLRSHHAYLLADGLADHLRTRREIGRIQAQRASFDPADIRAADASGSDPRVYVFVIGESANRNHLAVRLPARHNPAPFRPAAPGSGGRRAATVLRLHGCHQFRHPHHPESAGHAPVPEPARG